MNYESYAEVERTLLDGMLYAMEGEDPSKAFENMERRGQSKACREQLLPKMVKMNDVPKKRLDKGITLFMNFEQKSPIWTKNVMEYTKECYDRLGITVLSESGNAMYSVQLPDGWTIESTDHPMWNNLLDDKGRNRAKVFYKACCGIMDEADITFNTRYYIFVDTVSQEGDWRQKMESGYIGYIKDRDNDSVIYQTDKFEGTTEVLNDSDIRRDVRKVLEKYMEKNYPEYEDIFAYWN